MADERTETERLRDLTLYGPCEACGQPRLTVRRGNHMSVTCPAGHSDAGEWPEVFAAGAFDGCVGQEVPLSVGGVGGPVIGSATVVEADERGLVVEMRVDGVPGAELLWRPTPEGRLPAVSTWYGGCAASGQPTCRRVTAGRTHARRRYSAGVVLGKACSVVIR